MLIDTPDDRRLSVETAGDSGPALLFHHGTPSTAETYAPWLRATLDAGLRWVSFTRAGYGDSTRRPGRTVADDNDDVVTVLDHLGVDRFVAVGWSGGGPHALACGAGLAPRCSGVVALASVAPWDSAGRDALDWFDGMGQDNLDEYGAAQQGELPLRAFLAGGAEEMSTVTGAQLATSLGTLVDDADRAVLTGDFADAVAAHFREAVRTGVDGWVDDDLAFCAPWGFALADVGVPVSLWQGAQDRMVPYAHGGFLADRLPDVRRHLLPDDGHLSIPLGRWDEILADITSVL